MPVKRYSELTPEQQKAVEAFRARRRTPEARAEIERVRDLVMDEIPPKPPDPPLAGLFAALKAERERLGLTLAEVSAATGINVANLSRMERGRVSNPTYQTLARLAAALGQEVVLGVRPAR